MSEGGRTVVPGQQIRRVAVLGSSISMVVRPRGGPAYPHLLECLLNQAGSGLWLVANHSRIAATIDDVKNYLPTLVADAPDVVVLHYGHVEAIPRPHSRAEWHRTYGVAVGESPFDVRVRLLRRKLAAPRRRLGLQWPWTPFSRYSRILKDSLAYLDKEIGAHLIVVEANPGNAKIEQWGRGSLAAIARYNEASREIADLQGATWVSLRELLSTAPEEEWMPDGTHFSPAAHAAAASTLAGLITARDGV